MLGLRVATETAGTRGLGRRVDADAHLRGPALQPWSRVIVHEDDRTLSVSWCRGAELGLHSVVTEFTPDAIRVGTLMGTRPAFYGKRGFVVLRMIVEHAVIRLREPVRGRRIEVMQPRDATLTRIV